MVRMKAVSALCVLKGHILDLETDSACRVCPIAQQMEPWPPIFWIVVRIAIDIR